MGYKRAFAAHVILLAFVVVGIWALVIYLAVSKGLIKIPFIAGPGEPKVELRTEYQNPFNKQTQYVNPFDQTKNPFAVAK